ncbi:MAG TPA: hypothetical protein VFU41_09825 [Gemmatimonadales bacterium]|nr:hypothetical protein [Gemmatimonadales bacterium]
MHRSLRAAALLALAVPAGLAAPRPAVSPAATPAGITPLAPVDPALGTVTPDFSWSLDTPPPPGTPVAYRLRIARDSALVHIVVDTVTDTAGYALQRPLKPGQPLFWHVDAPAAGATTGLVGPIAVPPWATLTSLSTPGGVNTADAQPTLTWLSPAVSTPPGPFRYDVFVRRAAPQFADVPDVSVAGLRSMSYQIPSPLERNLPYVWSLVVHADPDTSLVRSTGAFMVVDGSVPPATQLYQNFPNPFPAADRDSTCLWFDLAMTTAIELEILDLRGNAVRHFVPGPEFPGILPAGRYGRSGPGGPTCDPRLMWDGRADDGRQMPAGVYLYKLKAGGIIQFRRMVFRGRHR